MSKPAVSPGLDVLARDGAKLIGDQRVGLLTHAASVTSQLIPAVDVVSSIPGIDLRMLLAPEHGLASAVGDALPVPDEHLAQRAIPVYSLYGTREAPTEDMLEEIDVVVCDLVDIGSRFYTYSSTLFHVIRACGKVGKRVVVCDRPNPVAGILVEGPVAKDMLFSEFAVGPSPIRHGLTMGELARLYVDEWGVDCDVEVIRCPDWKRNMYFDDTGLVWVPPSPAMPHPNTAIIYPGSCLFEGTNLSEGRGTALPFEQFGAPWLNPQAVINLSGIRSDAGVLLRPVRFTPESGKWKGVACDGIQIHVTDRRLFRPVRLAFQLLLAIRQVHPNDLDWALPHFDLLTGNEAVRNGIDNLATIEELEQLWIEDLRTFADSRNRVLLY